MLSSRTLPWLVAPLVAALTGCPQGAGTAAAGSCGPQTLPGIDTSELTARELCEWGQHVSELLAPCPEVTVSVAECVSQSRPCPVCLPAAEFLVKQVRAGKPKADVVEQFEARFDPKRVKTIVVGSSPALGAPGARVTIVEWADFECPSCAAMARVLHAELERFPTELRLVYKHYPISYHTYALSAARAAVAAHVQGKFWPMHALLFERQSALTESDLVGYAGELGLDQARFERDLRSPEVAERVEQDKRQGESLGVHATPTLFINGREVVRGSLDQPLEDLAAWIELESRLAPPEASPP